MLLRIASTYTSSVNIKIFNTIYLAGLLLFTASCSSESLKRISYETVQNIGAQKCAKELSSDCQAREPYDDYQRKRKNNKVTP